MVRSFIHNQETRHLYRIIVQKVRKRRRFVRFPFRCDSPDEKRFLRLTVIPLTDDFLEFRSKILSTESRKPMTLLRCDIVRSDEFILICSMCKKIAVSDNKWLEVEEAIQLLKLFDKYPLPQLTHGICLSCYRVAMAELEKSDTEIN